MDTGDWAKIILVTICGIGGLAFIIWFLVTWGNTPVGELPTWLWWLMN